MPNCVAHFQFGQQVLERLTPELKAAVLAYKREFDVGLQGPDIFFYHKPYRKTEVAAYGSERHHRPAIEMFAPMLSQVQQGAALSYMIGLICHYTLDVHCHPYVNEHSRNISDHHRMEIAYDRHIIDKDAPVTRRYLLAHTTGLDYGAMASLWPGADPIIDPATIRKCVQSQRFYIRLVDRRKLVAALETVAGKQGAFSVLSLPDKVPQNQRQHVQQLDQLYRQALREAPGKIQQAYRQMGRPLLHPTGFELNHGGEVPDEQAGEKLDPV